MVPYPSEPRASYLVNPGSHIPEEEGAVAALPAATTQKQIRRSGSGSVQRETFATSRRLEFLSVPELEKQSGYTRDRWPEVIIKELIDNALDACEEAGVAPEITVAITDNCIVVEDNGPGMPASTVAGIVNLDERVSSRQAYMAPDRGAQGNATKVLVGMPFALRPEAPGQLVIEAHGQRHVLAVTVDGLSDTPSVTLHTGPGVVKTGTRVEVHLPRSMTDPDSSPFLQDGTDAGDLNTGIMRVILAYVAFNPHLTILPRWHGDTYEHERASDTAWIKWRPCDPTSVHWYNADKFAERVKRCIAADRAAGQDRPVSQFVQTFDGMSGSAVRRDVLAECGLTRTGLSALAPDGEPDIGLIGQLRDAMQSRAKVVPAKRLGLIGKDHLLRIAVDCDGDPDTFRYVKVLHDDELSPGVTEIGFAVRPSDKGRFMFCGVNWSAALRNPFRLRRGSFDSSLDAVLQEQYASDDEPVVLIIHHAQVGATYTDRGKGTLSLSQAMSDRIRDAIEKATGPWAKQRRAEDREQSRRLRRGEAMKVHKPRQLTVKEVAHEIMPEVYAEQSDDGKGGRLPVNARQLMYKARPRILARTGKSEMSDAYFTQTLLPDYIADNPDITADWDVVYDDRGHFTEPHTGRLVNLGTLDVRKYLLGCGPRSAVMPTIAITDVGKYPTHGSKNRFGGVLFIEKEGFAPLLSRVQLAERFDIAIMSTKGLSNVAARRLIDEVCGQCGETGLPLFVLHDFDKAGFSILGTLRFSSRRYAYRNPVEVIDLGVRLEDVRRCNLQSEPVVYCHGDGTGSRGATDPRDNLRDNGATDDEVAFLVNDPEVVYRNGKRRHLYRGQRVELNAFAPRDFVAWIEGKLTAHGVAKVVPSDDATLARQYRRGIARTELNRQLAAMEKKLVSTAEHYPVPATLRSDVEAMLRDNPAMPWDMAVLRIASTLKP